MTIHQVIRRPLVTEKGVQKKDTERTLCFEVSLDANNSTLLAGAACDGLTILLNLSLDIVNPP